MLSPFSFFSHPQVSYSPQSPPFPLVASHAISLSSGRFYRNVAKDFRRVFSPFDTIHSSLELAWAPCCSFWKHTNPNHADRIAGNLGSGMAPGWPGSSPPAEWPWRRACRTQFPHLQNGNTSISLVGLS